MGPKYGTLVPTLKFELSAEGLQDYRLLLLLEKLVKRGSAKNDLFKRAAKKWLSKVQKSNSLYSSKEPFTNRGRGSYPKFQIELRKHLENLIK